MLKPSEPLQPEKFVEILKLDLGTPTFYFFVTIETYQNMKTTVAIEA